MTAQSLEGSQQAAFEGLLGPAHSAETATSRLQSTGAGRLAAEGGKENRPIQSRDTPTLGVVSLAQPASVQSTIAKTLPRKAPTMGVTTMTS